MDSFYLSVLQWHWNKKVKWEWYICIYNWRHFFQYILPFLYTVKWSSLLLGRIERVHFYRRVNLRSHWVPLCLCKVLKLSKCNREFCCHNFCIEEKKKCNNLWNTIWFWFINSEQPLMPGRLGGRGTNAGWHHADMICTGSDTLKLQCRVTVCNCSIKALWCPTIISTHQKRESKGSLMRVCCSAPLSRRLPAHSVIMEMECLYL